MSFIGYSQNPIQPNHENFNDDIPQHLLEKIKPFDSEFVNNDVINFNPIQRVGGMKPQSFQSEINNQSDNGITYRLDEYKYIYYDGNNLISRSTGQLDENGNETLSIFYSWNTDSQSFVPIHKNEHTYDENGNQTLWIEYSWNTDSQSFVPSNKHEYNYDENGNQTLIIFYRWNTDSQFFVPNSKSQYTFDENGNQTLSISYSWDTNTQSFVPSWKYEYTYNENGNQTLRIKYSWDTNTQSFVPSWKHEYNYDENGNRTLSISYVWDLTTQSYIPNRKHEYYDNGNRIISSFIWDSVLEIFIQSNKESPEYDEQNRITFTKSYQIDICNHIKTQTDQRQYTYDDELDGRTERYFIQDSNGDFIFNYEYGNFYDKENGFIIKRLVNVNLDLDDFSEDDISYREYSYDIEGNLIEVLLSKWDTQTESLVLSEKELRVYDYDFRPRYITQWKTEKFFNGIGFKPSFVTDYSIHSETDTELVIVGITKQYDTNFNTWNELIGEEFREYYYYTKDSSLSTNSVEPNSFSIYPNPTSNTLQINSSEYLKTPIFELYDVKGSKILSSPFKLTEPIDVSDLQPSMYIYNVKDGSELKQSGKVLIE